MRTASLLIVALTLNNCWVPSFAASIDISNVMKGANATGGAGYGTSGIMPGGGWGGYPGQGGWGGYPGQGGWGGYPGQGGWVRYPGQGDWGGYPGQGGWGGYPGQGGWGGYSRQATTAGNRCDTNFCDCASGTGCKSDVYSRTVIEGSDGTSIAEIYTENPGKLMEKRMANRRLLNGYVTDSRGNLKDKKDRRVRRSFLVTLSPTTATEIPLRVNGIKDEQRNKRETVKYRVPKSAAARLNVRQGDGASDEVPNTLVKQLMLKKT